MNRENRFKMLTKSQPEVAQRLWAQAQQDAEDRWAMYEYLASRDYSPDSNGGNGKG
jgi:pyruvate-ferredoxin/flavodoxin oxidoreductase